jgi:protein phosphatase
MGTTVVGLMIDEMEVALAHVGDSRAYLVHDQGITQLTVDDTLVQQMVEAGTLKPEEALSHPDAHYLTRCLGMDARLEVPIQQFWRAPGEVSDVIVLCSDGLYGLVSDVEIADAVHTQSPERAATHLVALANERGGYDNITVSIIPLHGTLTDEPPANWDAMRAERERRRAKLNRPPLSMSAHTFILFSLALVSALVTACVFGVQQSLIS